MEETLKRAAAAETAEIEIEPAEDILEVDAAEQVFLTEALHAGKSARVVLGTFLRVGQDGIGLGNFLEPLFRPGFLVAVRVILHRKAAERILDRFLVGIFGDTEHFVVITLGGNDRLPFLLIWKKQLAAENTEIAVTPLGKCLINSIRIGHRFLQGSKTALHYNSRKSGFLVFLCGLCVLCG